MFRRRPLASPAADAAASGAARPAPEPQTCPSLARVLERLRKLDKPEILDLGPFCGDSAVYLAGRGARVSVGEYAAPAPAPKLAPGAKAVAPALTPITLAQPDER